MPNFKYAFIDDSFRDFRSQDIRVRVAKNDWEKNRYYSLRKKIFSNEQKILSSNERDVKDFRAIPIVALASTWSVADDVVGAVRIYEQESENPHERIWFGGRLCVERAYRGHQTIGKALINEAVSRAKDLGCTRFLANVQPQNERYFKSVHWHTMGDVEVAGKRHIHMAAELDAYPFMLRDVR